MFKKNSLSNNLWKCISYKWWSLSLGLFILVGCQSENQRPKTIENQKEPDHVVSLESINNKKISQYLMGFNVVYAQEKDEIWSDGILVNSLRDVKTSVLRYPGGTVTTFYHWENPTGNGWLDKWDTQDHTPDKPKSDFMDVDEYMQLIRETGATPMMGINLSSAWRWNRIEDGIAEALRLMQYCKDKHFPVTFWYLDNEPYQHDANGGSKTPEQYGELINSFAERMKAFDPNIKIVANWNAGFTNKRADYEKLISIAGKNIDMIDVHWYWSWGNPTWEKWTSGPVRFWTGTTYVEEIASFRKLVTELGYPDIQLGSFEWNVGPAKTGDLSSAQCALIQTEMMMQFMSGGLDMAFMWPLHWPTQFKARGFYNADAKQLNPIHHIFKFLGDFQGNTLLDLSNLKPDNEMFLVSALSNDEEILRVILLNKSTSEKISSINSMLFQNMKMVNARKYVLDETKKSYRLEDVNIEMEKKDKRIEVSSEPFSITMLTFARNNKNS